jgi:transcriptional regulator with XRE-family HTH domain
MVLLRHLLGDVLRRLRQRQGRTLREVSASARVSLGYLSEVERGQKEASSELLAAICTALNTPLSHVLGEVSDSFALAELQNEAELQSEPVLASAGASRSGQSAVGQSAAVQSPMGRPPLERAERELQVPVARAFSGQQRLRVPAGHARGMDSEPVITPVGINQDHPAFDEVTRRVRDLGDMVPV